MNDQIFKNFAEFWFYTKFLTDAQRQSIIANMSRAEQKRLKTSYRDGGWEDLLMRNKADRILDEIKREFNGCDLLLMRAQILGGKKVSIKKKFWHHINKKFHNFSARHIQYIFGDYRAVEHEDEKDWYKLIPSEE